MPSPRRVRLLMVAVLAIVVTTLFFTSQMRATMPRDARTIDSFFGKTVNGLEQQHGGQGQVVMGGKGSVAEENPKDRDGDGTVGEDDEQLVREMSERLRAAEQKAKELANAKAPLKPDRPSEVVGVGSSAGGQKFKPNKGAVKDTEEEEEDEEGKEEEEEEKEEEEARDMDDTVEVTLNQILKKSPVVIFSKSYCPFSKRAKGVLLEKYSIDPAPYVVELDEHPLGKELQARLAELTGRKTVPNILVNGKTIGGGDEVSELDAHKTLIDKIKALGGKRLSMKERFAGKSKDY